MSRLRLLLLVGCVGALVSGGSVLACVTPEPAAAETTPSRSGPALALLERAAAVSRDTGWRGTQTVVSTRGNVPRFEMRALAHTPGAGTVVEGLADTGRAIAPDLLDADLFALLTRHYDLTVLGDRLCDGRPTTLVEARRPGFAGAAAVAGRFWIDRATDMVWRRDVLDPDGSLVVSNSFTELELTAATTSRPPSPPAATNAAHLADDEVRQLVEQGWPIADHLPSGMELFDALRHTDGVVQLAYSDGLSTLSLFVQEGALPDDTGGTVREVGGGLVHVTSNAPEQLVWAGGGRTWTLVSNAPDATIEQAVLVLPHADPPAPGEGMGDRVWRGMSRVGAWLNPFD